MSVIYGVWFALAGGVAVLAGWSGMHRRRRLRRDGMTAWAMIVPSPSPPSSAADADQPSRKSSRRIMVQFALDDGGVIERACTQRARKSDALKPGQLVLVWYDPADPGEVLVYGRSGRQADRVFLVAGLLFVLLGVGVAVIG